MSETPPEMRLNQKDEQGKQRDEEDAKPSPEQANGQADRNDRSEEDFETFDEDDDFDEFELHNWEPDQAAVEEEDLDWQDDWDMIDQDEDFAAKLAAELGQHGYTGGEQTTGMES
ncbi:hypothetical protein CCYA_CCYA10G2788 [Cyanidiococcus yangmingshanensis]|nr:hypothetical protein CCYA_CCYA10G2788 [Cyanidiococcus yangmingshanensis]